MSFLKFTTFFLNSQLSLLDLSKMCTDEVLSLELSGNSILQTRGDWGSVRQYEMVIAQSPSELAWNTLGNMVGALLTYL